MNITGSLRRKLVNTKSTSKATEQIIIDLYANLLNVKITYGGRQDMPSIAKASLDIVYLSNKHVRCSLSKKERFLAHEARHVANNALEDRGIEYLFMFWSERFQELSCRIEEEYNKVPSGILLKVFGRDKVTDWISDTDSYIHPNETLALIQGYKVWMKQGRPNNTEYCEFVDAFEPKDTELLKFKVIEDLIARGKYVRYKSGL